MTNKQFMDKYYTHETILKECYYNSNEKILILTINYCEWQLEEINNKNKGYLLSVKNIGKLSNKDFFKNKNEFILEIKLNKKNGLIYLENDQSLEFTYNTFEITDL